jgi:hypothetical protein
VTSPELAAGDRFGPERVVSLRRPEVGLAAAVVVDNTAAGPPSAASAWRPT